MPFQPPSDYWLEVPAGRYRVGLAPDEARLLAEQSAAWFKHKGVDWSPNEGKMIRKAAEMLDTTGNAAWVEKYLLAHFPAREVELRGFAIAKQPITNRQYRQFMAETGDSQEPSSWSRDEANRSDDRAASGLSWWQALAVCEWAGCRLPFEDEWERAVRGGEHRIYPWGRADQLAKQIWDNYYAKTWPISTSRTPDGLQGAVCGQPEWCGDLWSEARGVDGVEWGEEAE